MAKHENEDDDNGSTRANINQSMDTVRNQLTTYGTQISEYLGKIDAKVDRYKFSVEKIDGGLSIDFQLSAMIKNNQES